MRSILLIAVDAPEIASRSVYILCTVLQYALLDPCLTLSSQLQLSNCWLAHCSLTTRSGCSVTLVLHTHCICDPVPSGGWEYSFGQGHHRTQPRHVNYLSTLSQWFSILEIINGCKMVAPLRHFPLQLQSSLLHSLVPVTVKTAQRICVCENPWTEESWCDRDILVSSCIPKLLLIKQY